MHLLINVVPHTPIAWEQLLQLSAAINRQRFSGVVVNLQVPTNTLTAAQRQQLMAAQITMAAQPTVTTGRDSYLINLQDTDTLLPGALAQWQGITTQYPGELISLATFDRQLDLQTQIDDYLADHADDQLLTTYRQLTATADVWPQLWGLQSYTVQTNLTSSKHLSQRIRPTGVLLPSDLLDQRYPLAAVAQNLHLLAGQRAVLRLHVPTLQTGVWQRDEPLAWFRQLQAASQVDLDAIWEPLFTAYYQGQLNKLLNTANHTHLTAAQHQDLLTQIRQIPALHPRRWSRLSLLRWLSPNLAHQLFF